LQANAKKNQLCDECGTKSGNESPAAGRAGEGVPVDHRAGLSCHAGDRSAGAEQEHLCGPGPHAVEKRRYHLHPAAGDRQHIPHNNDARFEGQPVEPRVLRPDFATVRRLASGDSPGLPAGPDTDVLVPLLVDHVQEQALRAAAPDHAGRD